MRCIFASNERGRALRHALLVCSPLAAGLASVSALAQDDDDDRGGGGGPLVNTVEGLVRGYTKGGVSVFLGVPYAAPPVGGLRWRPPQPVKHWQEALDATHSRNTCPQVTELGVFAGPASITEDCLYLNVFTTGGRWGHNKPVLVWIHDGGNTSGASNDYDASKLATGGPTGVETAVGRHAPTYPGGSSRSYPRRSGQNRFGKCVRLRGEEKGLRRAGRTQTPSRGEKSKARVYDIDTMI